MVQAYLFNSKKKQNLLLNGLKNRLIIEPQLRSGQPFDVESEDFHEEYEEMENSSDTKSLNLDDLENCSSLDDNERELIKELK
jgi:hypothetical protein